MIIEKREFTKGLNSDLPAKLIPNGQYLNLMNGSVGVSQYGRDTRIETRPGTTLISNTVYPPYGTHFTLGSAIDLERRRIVYLNWNSAGYHAIYCYFIDTGITYAVIYDSQVTGGLGFSKSYRIDRNCRVVGDLFYWTDNNNEVRKINIEAGIKMNHASYSTSVTPYSWPMTQSVIRLIKRSPGAQIGVAKGGSSTSTLLKTFAGTAALRYVYRDGEYSVWGNPSQFINHNDDSDNSQYVTIGWGTGTGETIDQDVQEIHIGIAYNNDSKRFTVKKWSKSNAADLAVINAFNAGSGPLEYNFYNDIIGDADSPADSVKPFDSIPTKVKTLEYANNRLFLANYTKGYSTPSTTSLSGSVSSVAFGTRFKSFSSYQIGIVFRDFYKRKCGVVTNTGLIVTIPDRTYADTLAVNNMISWTLSNVSATTEIPDWAYYYDIVLTKNLRTRFYVQAKSTLTQYAYKDADGVITYSSSYSASAYGLAFDLSTLTGQGMGYVFNEGDLVNFYLASPATTYRGSVISQDGNNVIVQLQNLGSLVAQPDILFELYTPYQRLESETFYSTGRSYTVTNPGTGARQYSTTSGTLPGDTYSLNRPLVNCERMSPNDTFWQDNFAPFGDANIVTQLGQVVKDDFVQWSNVKINGAVTNGLSTFDAGDEKPLQQAGGIQKLQLTNKVSDMGQGNIMLAIFPTETACLYLSETQVMASAKSTYVAQSSEVIGSVNFLTGSSGTVNPESVIPYLGSVYWLDALNGAATQYSPAGLEFVSRYDMTRFFANYLNGYVAASTGNLDNINGFHHIPSAIDPFHKEVLFTLPGLIYSNYATTLPSYTSVPSYASSIIDRFDIYDQLGKTMSFKFLENKWGHNFEFMGEWYEYFENKMFGFKNGYLYTHNTNTSAWNTFYGVQYPLRVCFTGNFDQSLLKLLNNIGIEGSQLPNFTVAMTRVPNTQITDLASTDSAWVNQEGNLYATFYADRLSPNTSGTADQKLYTGDSLTDTAFLIMCEWQEYSQLCWINFINLGMSGSRGQKRISNPDNS